VDKLRTLAFRPQRAWPERVRLFFVLWGRDAATGKRLLVFQGADLRRAAEYLQGAVRVVGDQCVGA